jgi:hypothetical protein
MLQKRGDSQKNLPKWGELSSAVDREQSKSSASPVLLEGQTWK